MPNVIITLGAKGAFDMCDQIERIISTPKVKAEDTKAAGDTFNGALAVAVRNGLEIREAVEFANKAAALSVMKIGAQASIPELKDLMEQ